MSDKTRSIIPEKNTNNFYCTLCDCSWKRKCDLDRHNATSKHIKCHQEFQNKAANAQAKGAKVKTVYFCDYCHFYTNNKKQSEKHAKSKEHIKNEYKEENFLEINKHYLCCKCEKKYDNYKSCWDHSNKCRVTEKLSESCCQEHNEDNTKPHSIDIEAIKKEVYENMVIKMLENNTNVMEKIAENNANMMEKVSQSTGQMLEIANTIKNSHNNIIQTNIQNNTDNSVTNNHCTVNVFLNEKCKNAMNIFDFITNMNITFDDLYHQADNGFQKGVTKILLDNLKPLSIYNRPIHFTDLKREIMYIKDNNEWTKHDDKEKLIEALEWAATQGVNCFVDWREATAEENKDLDSPMGQMWMKLMQTVVHPYNDRMKAYPKIMKEIARNVHLRKEDQT